MTELSLLARCHVAILHLAQQASWARRGQDQGPVAARGQQGTGTGVGTCSLSQREACLGSTTNQSPLSRGAPEKGERASGEQPTMPHF